MNKLVIPPPPSWYETNVLACAPDNTIIYASRNDVVVIYPKPPEDPADIKILSRCHRDRVVGVVVNPNWGNPDKLAASIADDKVVCLLDIATCKVQLAHSGHTTRSDKLVGVTFAGHDRVISVSEDGFIVIWRWASNQLNSLSDLLGSKIKVTCVSSCPHASWLTAFGLRRGEIVITDLRKTGRVLYKLKGHDTAIISLSWCPTPYNIFPKYVPKNAKSILQKVQKTIDDKPLDVSENISHEIKEDESSPFQKVAEGIITPNVVDHISSEHQSETEEVKIAVHELDTKAPLKSISGVVNHEAESFSTRDVIEMMNPNFQKVAKDIIPIDVMEIISPTSTKDHECISTEDLPENASAIYEIKAENISSTNEEKNTCLKPENVNTVVSTEDLIEITSSKIINETVNTNISTEKDLETVTETPKVETVITQSNSSGKVVDGDSKDVAKGNSMLAVQDAFQKESLPSAEANLETLPEIAKVETVITQSNSSGGVVDAATDNSMLAVQDAVEKESLPSTKDDLETLPEITEVETIITQSSSSGEVEDAASKDFAKDNSILAVQDGIQKESLPSTKDDVETLLEITKLETVTIQSNSCGEVVDAVSKDVTEQNSIAAMQDANKKESSPLHEINKNQEPQVNNYEDHDGTVENIEAAITAKENSTRKRNASLVNENGTQQSQDIGENFQNHSKIANEPAKEFLLASSARGGRSIIIWRAGTDGIKQAELNLPGKSRGNQRASQSDEKSWITLCWITPKNLLSSSAKGELLQWNLATPSNTKGTYKSRLIHGDHHRHVFGIAAPIRVHESPDDEDWRDRNLLNAWTVGKDRLVLNTSLCAERKALASYPTISGSINCLAPSVIYPSKIAIGAGEGSCRLWDLSRPHLQYNVMTQFSDRSQHKIVSLAWHPTKETILAFGTTDGRVGLMDPCNCSKPPTYLVQYVNGAVHRLDWGPFNGNREHFLLYAVTGGKLIAYDINKRLDAPIVFDVCENVAQMAWKPDYSMCALATKAGHVSLFSPEMKLITTFYLQNKSVRWITWHPEATIEDDGVSPYANWLAVASNDVTVYDCSLDDGRGYSERVVGVFNDHSKFVECLSWSTFEGGKLASASDDGTALVWDVTTKTLLHTCVMPKEDVFTSVLWSPLDRDYIITGAKNSTIKIWKLSENPPQERIAKKQHHKILKLKEDEAPLKEVETEDTEENEDEVEEIEKPKKSTRRFVLGGLVEAHHRNSSPALLRDCKRLFAVHYGKTDNGNKSKNGEVEDDKQLDILKVFGDEHNLDIVLDLEKKCNSKKKMPRSSSHISLWRGDTANAIREAIRTRTLNPWIISMAPTVSHNLYLEACEAYADHLAEDFNNQAYEVVSYYLACHKLEKAIDLLCATKNFLEAVVLAKCRLVHTDPLITKIIERWAKHCATTGNFEVAAQCYIVLHRLEDAAKVLFRRTDEKTLKFCAELAKHCDDKNILDAVLFRLSAFNTPEDAENPDVPLLTRLEVELHQQKLEVDKICNDGSPSEDVPDASSGKTEIPDEESDLINENDDKITLGDGQCVNNTSCFDANNQNLDVPIQMA